MAGAKVTRRSVIGGAAATVGVAAVAGDVAVAASGSLDHASEIDDFIAFSAEVTGFPQADIRDTGQAHAYFATVREAVGDEVFSHLLGVYREGGAAGVLRVPNLAPVARNIVKLWYIATWEQLPSDWRAANGERPGDRTFIVSADAYATGLLWAAVGANPPGANPPGYGTWAAPPDG